MTRISFCLRISNYFKQKCFKCHETSNYSSPYQSFFEGIIGIIQLKMIDNLLIKRIVSIRICSDFYNVIKRGFNLNRQK